VQSNLTATWWRHTSILRPLAAPMQPPWVLPCKLPMSTLKLALLSVNFELYTERQDRHSSAYASYVYGYPHFAVGLIADGGIATQRPVWCDVSSSFRILRLVWLPLLPISSLPFLYWFSHELYRQASCQRLEILPFTTDVLDCRVRSFVSGFAFFFSVFEISFLHLTCISPVELPSFLPWAQSCVLVPFLDPRNINLPVPSPIRKLGGIVCAFQHIPQHDFTGSGTEYRSPFVEPTSFQRLLALWLEKLVAGEAFRRMKIEEVNQPMYRRGPTTERTSGMGYLWI